MELLHHYTSIDVLELILKNRTLRFGRLDNLDDKQESHLIHEKHWAQYLFVSSWCKDHDENFRLWREYTNNKGVRISLPKFPFEQHVLISKPKLNLFFGDNTVSPIQFSELYNDEWMFFLPPIREENFGKDIVYVDNPDEHISPPIERRDDGYHLTGLFDLAIVKNAQVWKEQNEFRYILFVVPSYAGAMTNWERIGDPKFHMAHIAKCIINGVPSTLSHFDVKLGDALDDVVITMGPECSDYDRRRVNTLLAKYTLRGTIFFI